MSTLRRPALASSTAALLFLSLSACSGEAVNPIREGWSQWGQNPGHTGQVSLSGQKIKNILADVEMDPFVMLERTEAGEDEHGTGPLLVHYQAPLVDGEDVFIASKGGDYVACFPPGSGEPFPCGVEAWDSQIWREERWAWEGSALSHQWTFESDWKPVPAEYGPGRWEPVFHAALAGDVVVVPASRGRVAIVDRATGALIRDVDPLGAVLPDTSSTLYTTGPVTVGLDGDILYHVVAAGFFSNGESSFPEITGAWLVKARVDGSSRAQSFESLVIGAPPKDGACPGNFRAPSDALPWPPSPTAVPGAFRCGVQRPGINTSPAVGPDGTIYTVSRAENSGRASFLLAINPDLTPKWSASLQGHLKDGCDTGVVPANGSPGGCREGARAGVDPATNDEPAGIVTDSSTSAPVVTPEGSVLYGAYTRYNYSRGHLFHFNEDGTFRASYDFGWDVTPAIYARPGGYSIVIKDNNYGGGSYCNDVDFCPPVHHGPYFITQLSPDLEVEWKYMLTNTQSCIRHEDGKVSCVNDHPAGFEWCINAPAIDQEGVVYSNGEDGVLYAIDQGGKSAQSLFLGEALGAAYTPLSIDAKGRVLAENVGRLFVVGE